MLNVSDLGIVRQLADLITDLFKSIVIVTIMNKTKNNKKNSIKSKIIVLSILFLVLAAGTVAVLELTNTTYFFHEKSLIVSTGDQGVNNQETKGETTPNDDEATTNDSSEKDPSPGGNGEAPDLAAPQGNFVSNHYPNLSGSPAPNKMQSSCTTTPGATCQIVFTNTSDGTVRSLPIQTTDQGGTAIWDWNLKDIGITEGLWNVKAVAALDGQTKTANDALNLEVKP